MRQIVRHTATVAEDGTIALPPEIRRLLGVEEGGTIVIERTGNNVHLVGAGGDVFSRYQGSGRVGKGLTLEEILAEEREMRGWDDDARQLSGDDDNRDR